MLSGVVFCGIHIKTNVMLNEYVIAKALILFVMGNMLQPMEQMGSIVPVGQRSYNSRRCITKVAMVILLTDAFCSLLTIHSIKVLRSQERHVGTLIYDECVYEGSKWKIRV